MTEKTIVLPPPGGPNGADANYRLTVMAPKRRYLSYLRNRWWVVMICSALAVAGIVTYETIRAETYISRAQLYLTLGPQLGANIFAESKDDFATQIELLKGARLGNAAMESLGAEATKQLKHPVLVEVVRPMQTTILQLKATSSDASVSQHFLEALIAQFLDFKKQTRLSTTEDVVASLNEELSVREAALKDSQQKLAEFQKTNNISLIQEEAKTEGFYLSEMKLQLQKLTLERQLLELGVLPTPAAAASNAVLTGATNLISGMTNSPAGGTNGTAGGTNLMVAANSPGSSSANGLLTPSVESELALKNARIDLSLKRAERDQMLTNRGPMAVRPLDAEVARLVQKVAVLESTQTAELQEKLLAAEKRIAAMEETIPTIEASVRSTGDLLSQAQLMKDEVQRKQIHYDNLLGMLRNIDLNKNMAEERVTVLDAPSSGRPAERYLPLRVFMALVGGVFVASGLVFVWYWFDDRLVSVHDLKDQFGETILGLVPQIKVPPAQPREAMLAVQDSRPRYAESFRHLRSALLLSSSTANRPQTLLFTGALPGEGKTTVAVNLAKVLARSGLRVALVDADPSHPTGIHELLGLKESIGVLDFLRGDVAAEAVLQDIGEPRLTFVSSGTHKEHTEGLFMRPQFGELMKVLREHRDFIILDAAPILASDDSALLVPHTDAVVLVVRSFFSRSRQIRQALEMLYQRQAKEINIVFNRAREDDFAGNYAANKMDKAAKNGTN